MQHSSLRARRIKVGKVRGASAALALLVLAGCGGGSDSSKTETLPQASARSGTGTTAASPTSSPPTSATSSATTRSSTPTSAAGATTLSETKLAEFPKTALFSDAEFRVMEALLSNAKPDFGGKATKDLSPDPTLYMKLTLINKLPSQEIQIFRNNSPLFRLVAADGTTVADVVKEAIQIRGGGSQDIIATFPLKAGADPSKYTLLIGLPNQAPTSVPIAGAVPALGYPIDLKVSGSGPAKAAGSGCHQMLDVSVLGGALDVDLGEPEPAPGSSPFVGRRAVAGARYLRLGVRIFNQGDEICGGGDTNINNDTFKLAVDGVPKELGSAILKARDGSLSLIKKGAAKEFVLAWEVPMNAKTVVFQAGNAGKTLYSLPVSLPSDLPKLAGEK